MTALLVSRTISMVVFEGFLTRKSLWRLGRRKDLINQFDSLWHEVSLDLKGKQDNKLHPAHYISTDDTLETWNLIVFKHALFY